MKADRCAANVFDLPEDVLAVLFTNRVAKNGAQHPDDRALVFSVILHVISALVRSLI
jgi:hypothetical protein